MGNCFTANEYISLEASRAVLQIRNAFIPNPADLYIGSRIRIFLLEKGVCNFLEISLLATQTKMYC
jgi:hypothetical protein